LNLQNTRLAPCPHCVRSVNAEPTGPFAITLPTPDKQADTPAPIRMRDAQLIDVNRRSI
jgi:hypothetical protein